MKKHIGWSYTPFKPLLSDCGDIYISRVAPDVDKIELNWLPVDGKCAVFYRKKHETVFQKAGETVKNHFVINNLTENEEYAFYVTCNEKKSLIRLARCGAFEGDVVVNYLHPEDNAYYFSGQYLCSPSIVRHPEGFLLASMDLFKGNYPQNLTLIYRSDDNGKSWQYVSELFPAFWSKMFIYQNELYVLAVSTEYGDLLIGKSVDGGKSFTEPVVLFRGCNGKNESVGVHKNPQPVVEFNERIWNTMEWGSWGAGYHSAMVMSAPIGCDLLDAENWVFSEPVKYNPQWDGVAKGPSTGNIEGCLVVKDNQLYNVMRYDMRKTEPCYGLAVVYKVDTENPENPLKYEKCIQFPANHSKFVIKFDERTGKYYTIASRIIDAEHKTARNLLSLMSSSDLENWVVEKDVINMLDKNPDKYGYQYVDFEIEGDEIIFLCRTATNGAQTYHDTNYITFNRIKIE